MSFPVEVWSSRWAHCRGWPGQFQHQVEASPPAPRPRCSTAQMYTRIHCGSEWAINSVMKWNDTCLLVFFSSELFLSVFLWASKVAASIVYRHSVHLPYMAQSFFLLQQKWKLKLSGYVFFFTVIYNVKMTVWHFPGLVSCQMTNEMSPIKGWRKRKRYLLSRMYPSTLWSSFPKRPQGLKVMLHLSPVLPQNDGLFTILLLQAFKH